MSLRYTGEATMDEPALRDVERWKDKIEVRLDNRQVFFLFFGSAMVACMLFVLGVIVGKRLETRGHAEAPAIEDPLAVLDRFGAAAAAPVAAREPTAFAFPRALTTGGARANDSARGGLVPLTDREDRPVAAAPVAVAVERAVPASRPPERMTVKPTLTATIPALPASPIASPRLAPVPHPSITAVTAPAPVVAAPPAASALSRKLAALPRPLPPKATREAKEPTESAEKIIDRTEKLKVAASPGGRDAVAATKVAAAVKAPAALPAADKGKGRFLLQLSSFQDRAEADAFARRFGAQNAYVVATEIPGKGTWYRVRVGSYGNLQDATSAKAAFERDHNVIAYVAGGGPAK